MTAAATLSLDDLADALEADIVPFVTPSGTVLVSIDGGATAIGPTGKRVPVHSAWDEQDDDLAVDALAAPQIDALASLATMRERSRAATIAIAERRATNALASDERVSDDFLTLYRDIARFLVTLQRLR